MVWMIALTVHIWGMDRDKNKLVLDKYDKMLDLLKVPQLMEKRVKQGAYEEALQLQQFAKQLLKKHQGIPIIKSIVSRLI